MGSPHWLPWVQGRPGLFARASLSRGDLRAQHRDEMSYVRRGLQSEDGRAPVKAIMQKRPAKFEGR